MSALLHIQDLHCKLGGRPVLQGLSLQLEASQRVALLGPNGAGKSTLMRAVAGQLPEHQGQVRINGHCPSQRIGRQHIGVIPQRMSLFPRLSARENLEAFARLQGLSRKACQPRVTESLGWIDLTDRADEPVSQLSGGMQRRVSIACGAIHEPALLLADEPMVGVDTRHREPVNAMLDQLKQYGTSIIASTHELAGVDARYDRVVVMENGSIVLDGKPADILQAGLGLAHRCRITLEFEPTPAIKLRSGFSRQGRVITGPINDVGSELESLLAELRQAGLPIQEIAVEPPAIEDFVRQLKVAA